MLHQHLNAIHDTKPENILGAFYKAVQSLMQEHHLQVANECFDITELEFYYFNTQAHKDPYAHMHCMQLEFGKWYVHEKSIARGGIDYTFGNGINFGSILIRELRNQNDNKFITGPAKVRQEITDLFSNNLESESHSKLQALFNDNSIKLVKHHKKELDITCGKRIGLTEKSICFAANFQDKTYRFVANKKDKRRDNHNKPISTKYINDLKSIKLFDTN
ncbi:hypothetical protein [Sulfuricurvum sp.]|uniref:hypothetical protein n=1 Tax=Sulfuricurvum sp. TaxID=2025608 RepID=UPI00261BC387|nr:hypothetical protein [Sulfuricurvum sp.]MDD2781484.1 hypothetical protein [Sulfuricurvum sp.]